MKDALLKAFHFRHACKLFEEDSNIPKEDLDFILETGRLSPSSFGLEQWKFIVVQSRELKKKLKAACFDQAQLTTCSVAVTILAKKEELTPGSDYVNRMFKRFGFKPDVHAWLEQFYENYYKQIDVAQWSIAQCHIVAANMMTAAAAIGIDSCPIGGFEPEKVREALTYDDNKYEIALIIPFGYRKNPQPKKNRLSIEEIVEYR